MAEEAELEVIVVRSETIPEPTDPPDFTTGYGEQPPKNSDGESSSKQGYPVLFRAAIEGNWDAAEKIIAKDKKAATEVYDDMNILHAAAKNGQSEFVERLVERLPFDALAKPDGDGRTALHYIAMVGTVSAAKKMVTKNSHLPQQMDGVGFTPIYAAVLLRVPEKRREMVEYLATVSKDEDPSYAFSGECCMELIQGIITSGYYDIASDLIAKYSNLALVWDEEGQTMLHILAKDPSAFDQTSSKIRSGMRLLHPRQSRRMEQDAKKREEKLRFLVRTICDEVSKWDDEAGEKHGNPFDLTLFLATENGLVELLDEILKRFPGLIWVSKDEKLLLHVAIEHRRHDVFNYLIKQAGEKKSSFTTTRLRKTGDNILHVAARLPTLQYLHYDSGSLLQMQRELQWFKEVEKLLHPMHRWEKNEEKCTPLQLFIKEHKELQKSGEEWMKSTAENCMVVATLVATIVFAAIITVPGGLHGETGTPIFLQKIPFEVFFIANGLAVFTSMISLLVFLSILTSRFVVEDFHRSLPLRLITGLCFLLMAIVTMTIAFAAALHISLSSKFRLSFIFSMFLGCVPIILFVRLHLPLFFEVIKYTRGSGIFEQDDLKRLWPKLWDEQKLGYRVWKKLKELMKRKKLREKDKKERLV